MAVPESLNLTIAAENSSDAHVASIMRAATLRFSTLVNVEPLRRARLTGPRSAAGIGPRGESRSHLCCMVEPSRFQVSSGATLLDVGQRAQWVFIANGQRTDGGREDRVTLALLTAGPRAGRAVPQRRPVQFSPPQSVRDRAPG